VQVKNLGETLIALVGIWLIAASIPDFVTSLFALWTSGPIERESNLYFVTFVHLATKILVGLSLILTKNRIGKLLKLNSHVESSSSELLSAGIFLLGLYFVFSGIVFLSRYYFVFNEVSPTEAGIYWQGTVSIVCGLLLALFSFSFAKLWRLIRFAGT